jgi:hypothetical protein
MRGRKGVVLLTPEMRAVICVVISEVMGSPHQLVGSPEMLDKGCFGKRSQLPEEKDETFVGSLNERSIWSLHPVTTRGWSTIREILVGWLIKHGSTRADYVDDPIWRTLTAECSG